MRRPFVLQRSRFRSAGCQCGNVTQHLLQSPLQRFDAPRLVDGDAIQVIHSALQVQESGFQLGQSAFQEALRCDISDL